MRKTVEKQDFRSGTAAERAAIRKRGMAMIKAGAKKGKVALMLGVNPNTISDWGRKSKSEGNKGLVDKKRGARSVICILLLQIQYL